MHAHLRGRADVAPAVDVMREGGIELRVMRAVACRQTLQPCAIQLDAIHIAPQGTALRARKVNVLAINTVQLAHFPFAAGDLPDERAVRTVVSEVTETGAFRL